MLGSTGLAINQFTAKQADFADPTALSEEEWQEHLASLHENRRALARAAGTCERGLDARLAEGRISQVELGRLASQLKVRPIEASRAFCHLFVRDVSVRRPSLQQYNRAITASPLDVLKTIRPL
ncbi:hypothetical protein LP421_28165 [Rhizobium sp. RCAM05350]|nr:hypothetical protein LP421_28165 [Rhizobium sp. RCAM05350]